MFLLILGNFYLTQCIFLDKLSYYLNININNINNIDNINNINIYINYIDIDIHIDTHIDIENYLYF